VLIELRIRSFRGIPLGLDGGDLGAGHDTIFHALSDPLSQSLALLTGLVLKGIALGRTEIWMAELVKGSEEARPSVFGK